MLDHVSIAVADLPKAERFYDAVMAALGVAKVGVDHREGWIGYGLRADPENAERSYLSIRAGVQPEAAQGRHWCFKAQDRTAVQDFWRAGLEHGGSDDGAPGLRPAYHPHYFAAFLRDPSGNRVEAVCHQNPASQPAGP